MGILKADNIPTKKDSNSGELSEHNRHCSSKAVETPFQDDELIPLRLEVSQKILDGSDKFPNFPGDHHFDFGEYVTARQDVFTGGTNSMTRTASSRVFVAVDGYHKINELPENIPSFREDIWWF
ncbi:predicted protein [Sclerotinia sclerotiorum 1980 UF-70]|uniref:Uncharacterized protein n=1 Tax=Sclerotinia sclerotiorum (strain ATCC 18683 / 1980 / Ss-1) TaxID=665079 RepID=A7EUX6_SCLS1|nr:predicted protein [Sclerotinia sclerotiorum 1980 UF-70]EDN93268.1 predicted protein [Sclerotinia sclerotiorum 1980 UF-70]